MKRGLALLALALMTFTLPAATCREQHYDIEFQPGEISPNEALLVTECYFEGDYVYGEILNKSGQVAYNPRIHFRFYGTDNQLLYEMTVYCSPDEIRNNDRATFRASVVRGYARIEYNTSADWSL